VEGCLGGGFRVRNFVPPLHRLDDRRTGFGFNQCNTASTESTA
jgi:hypothetical protein